MLDQAVHMETAFFGKEQADRNLPSYTKHVLVSSYPVVTYKMAEDFLDELVVIPLAGEIPEEMREPAFFEKIKEERDAIVTIAIRSYECCHKMSGRFSGYYPVNCIPLPPPCEKICTNKEEAVQQFAETRCERNKETGTDATLLYDRFIREYGYITFTEFTNLFERCAMVLYGTKRAWVRHAYDNNLYSFFPFIRLKGQNPQESYPINYIKNPLGR